MLLDVLVTSRQIGPVIRVRSKRFLRVLLVRGCNGSLDVHSSTEMCDDSVVILDLSLRSISNKLYVFTVAAGILPAVEPGILPGGMSV